MVFRIMSGPHAYKFVCSGITVLYMNESCRHVTIMVSAHHEYEFMFLCMAQSDPCASVWLDSESMFPYRQQGVCAA
jgi:hypothetical protein